MKHYLHKYSLFCPLFCIVEQIIVAASTFAMIQIGHHIGNPERTAFWILVFAMLLFMVFIPRHGYLHYLLKAKYLTFHRFIADYENSYGGHGYLSRNQSFVNERKAVFHNETWNVVNESYDFILDFILTILNVCFSVGVIAVGIDKDFLLSYLAAFIVAFIFIRLSDRRTKELGLRAQQAHVDMNTVLIYGWDTILADNIYNKKIWNLAFRNRIGQAVQLGEKKLEYINLVSFVTMILSSVPIFLTMFLALQKSHSGADVAVLVVTLPRQINTIQYLSVLIGLFINWNGVYSKVIGIHKAINISEEYKFCPEYIKFPQIIFSKESQNYQAVSLEDLTGQDFFQSGRITIRGGNGVGKSTLLLGLKSYYGAKAYYFSPVMDVYYTTTISESLSTGEAILLKLSEILENTECEYLLLDEWDANLDCENMTKIDSILEEISRDICVVEIRHRG